MNKYSFNPLIDSSYDTHIGFYIYCFILIFVVYSILKDIINDEKISSLNLFMILFFGGLFALIHHQSYLPQIKYANIKVDGKFVTFQPELEKGTKNRTTQNLFVVYEIENRMVIFDADSKISYPKKAVFYKN